MAEYKVLTSGVQSAAQTESSTAAKLGGYASRVRTVSSRLSISSSAGSAIRSKLKTQASAIEKEQQLLAQMAVCLDEIRGLYENTEKRIVNGDVKLASDVNSTTEDGSVGDFFSSLWDRVISFFGGLFGFFTTKTTATEIDSILYDDDGDYGGDQGSPMHETEDRKDELYAIVRKYHPDMTDEEIDEYFETLNSEGCGYVALCNTILQYYEGREEEFEEAFGFSLYGDDGDLNYDMLLVDMYSALDDPTKTGTNQYSRKTILETYMAERGVDVEVTTDVTVTAENFSQLTAEGKSVIVALHDATLYNMNGTTKKEIKGGHAMTVTGVTEDGKLIVSSWGDKYYIDPDEFAGGTTTFSTIEFK